ncbi:MAG: hypothetical protein AAGK02_07605 [Pseudomonadota bacterium]
MQRQIVVPADLSGEPLQELKSWLGITRSTEDEMLGGLLGASLATCEAFIRQAPIEQTIEERIPPAAGQHKLVSRPVKAIVSVGAIENDGSISPLGSEAYRAVPDADGVNRIRVAQTLDAQAVLVRMVAGLAPDWGSLPQPIRHGIIRLSAFYYRDRNRDEVRQAGAPASVAALWRPWRLMRMS